MENDGNGGDSRSEQRPRWKSVLRALRHRNYQLFFFGQGVSQVGTWMQRVAQGWLVYDLTHSKLQLGVVGFSTYIFTFLAAPFAGVLADRMNRRRLLIVIQSIMMIQAFALAALTWTHAVTVGQIIALSMILGLVSAFDVPVRQSFVVEMIEDKADLSNAIALNSVLFNGAKLVGPSIAGALVAMVGEAACFGLNGASFLAVIAALFAMRVRPRETLAQRKHVFHNLWEGLLYAVRFAPIRALLFQLGIVSLLGSSYAVLMPVFAKDILHGGPQTLGLLMAASGVGAAAGALTLAARKDVRGLGRVIAASTFLFGISLIGFGLSRSFALSAFLLVLAGFGMMGQMASCNTVIQTIVDEDKRGRVMSFYTVALMGMMPFGSLLAGALANWIGASWAVVLCGGGCALAALQFAFRLPALRKDVLPIYVRLGIASETALAPIPVVENSPLA